MVRAEDTSVAQLERHPTCRAPEAVPIEQNLKNTPVRTTEPGLPSCDGETAIGGSARDRNPPTVRAMIGTILAPSRSERGR